MTKYRNLSGKSGVNAYQKDYHSIIVEFIDQSQYLYTDQSAGVSNIKEMQKLADSGLGLHTYINKNVRKLYQEKLR
jgi:hypothetical protein